MPQSSSPVTKTRTQKIRAHVSELHEALEATSVARRLESGGITPETYRHLHGQLWHLHRAVDDALEANRASLADLLHEDDLRAPLLREDLRALGALPPESPTPAVRSVRARLAPPRPERPFLVGVLYVIKGARFGGTVLATRAAEALEVPPEPGRGIDYYLCGQDALPRQWRSFLRGVDALELSEVDESSVRTGARYLMERHLALYRSYE